MEKKFLVTWDGETSFQIVEESQVIGFLEDLFGDGYIPSETQVYEVKQVTLSVEYQGIKVSLSG